MATTRSGLWRANPDVIGAVSLPG